MHICQMEVPSHQVFLTTLRKQKWTWIGPKQKHLVIVVDGLPSDPGSADSDVNEPSREHYPSLVA